MEVKYKKTTFELREGLAFRLKGTEDLGSFLELNRNALMKAVKQENTPDTVAVVCNELIRQAIQNPEHAAEIRDIVKNAPKAAIRRNIGEMVISQYKGGRRHPGAFRAAQYGGRTKIPTNVEQALWHVANLNLDDKDKYTLKKVPKKVKEA